VWGARGSCIAYCRPHHAPSDPLQISAGQLCAPPPALRFQPDPLPLPQQGLLPTTRAQLSYGAHILVAMFTLFMLGYVGGKAYLGCDELWVSGTRKGAAQL